MRDFLSFMGVAVGVISVYGAFMLYMQWWLWQ